MTLGKDVAGVTLRLPSSSGVPVFTTNRGACVSVKPADPTAEPRRKPGSRAGYLEDDGRERRLVVPVLVGFRLRLFYPVFLVCF